MRKVSHRMNAKILEGLADERLEKTATTLDAMKRNLLDYLQTVDARPIAGPG